MEPKAWIKFESLTEVGNQNDLEDKRKEVEEHLGQGLCGVKLENPFKINDGVKIDGENYSNFLNNTCLRVASFSC